MNIFHTAGRLTSLPATVTAAVQSVPEQATELVHDVQRLVRDAFALLDRIGDLVGTVEAVVEKAERVVDRAQATVTHADTTVRRADDVVEHIAVTSGETRAQVDRVRMLLDLYQPFVERLSPLVAQAAGTLQPAHLRGIARLLDELPEVVQLIHPAFSNLAQIGPEMGEIAERMDNVGQIVEGLPGSKLLRRRGSQKEPME